MKKWSQQQYTHAAIWGGISFAMLNFPDKLEEMYKIINPIEHAKTEEMAMKYKVEPYVVAADIYSADNLIGRGGWTWYTGSSSWLYILQVEYILGLKIKHEILKIEPCVPKDWNEFEVNFKWKNAFYYIKYERKEKMQSTEILLDGEKVEEIPLSKNGSYNVIVRFSS